MTEKELRRQITAAAETWLGRKEADGSHREILAVYNAIRPLPVGYAMKETDPWCAAFVSAAAAKSGLTEIVFPECSCPRMAALYKAAGRWEEVDFAVPKPGDVVFYDWNGDRVPDHVGLVTAAEGDYLTVIEGNKSDAVGRRRVHLDDKHILGYGQPDYLHFAEKTGSTSSASVPDPERKKEGAKVQLSAEAEDSVFPIPNSEFVALPVLSRGSRGEAVRAAQLLLIGRGCRCGDCGADGDFGAATCGAVQRYQRGRGLESDGVIGPVTWAALLGLGGAA